MKTRIKISETVLVVAVALLAIDKAFTWLNAPSDLSVWQGVLTLLAVFVLLPAAGHLIWHRKKQEQKVEEKTTDEKTVKGEKDESVSDSAVGGSSGTGNSSSVVHDQNRPGSGRH